VPFQIKNFFAVFLKVKQHDVLFLLTIRPPSGAEVAAMMEEEGAEGPGVREKYGLVSVRGCEVRHAAWM
jgi:intron-binding protein aquarius